VNACLLLVEDDPEDQRLLRYALRTSVRLTVEVASKGEAAIEYLARARPFLILSDIHLPGLSGWELLAWIRGRSELAGIPVLLWTSLPHPEGEERARRMGAAGYVGKPRDLDGYRQVAARVARLLGD
jgi:CheY-like chemotaxis protein